MPKKKNKEQVKELLKKLQTLAERGVGGEKITAQQKLEKLLAENGMTEKDLTEETVNYYLFSYKYPHKEKLLVQCIYKVVGKENFSIYHSKNTRNKIGTYCTAAQKLEIDLDYEFYSNLFDTEVDLLLSAFIAKQDIFPSDADSISISRDSMTEEEYEEYLKRVAYMNTISKRSRPTALLEDLKGGE